MKPLSGAIRCRTSDGFGCREWSATAAAVSVAGFHAAGSWPVFSAGHDAGAFNRDLRPDPKGPQFGNKGCEADDLAISAGQPGSVPSRAVVPAPVSRFADSEAVPSFPSMSVQRSGEGCRSASRITRASVWLVHQMAFGPTANACSSIARSFHGAMGGGQFRHEARRSLLSRLPRLRSQPRGSPEAA